MMMYIFVCMDMLVLVCIMSFMHIGICIRLCSVMCISMLMSVSMIICVSMCIIIRIKITEKRNIKCLRKPKK